MMKIRKKQLIILPLIAIFGVLMCTIGVKTDVINTITSAIKRVFVGNEEELIKNAAKNSGFDDVNLYQAVVDAYNAEHNSVDSEKDYNPIEEFTYIGGFNGEVTPNKNAIDFSDGEIAYYGIDTEVGRNKAGNRVGVKIEVPEEIKSLGIDKYNNAEIIRIHYYNDGSREVIYKTFKDVKDDDEYFTSWPLVKEGIESVEYLILWNSNYSKKYVLNFNNVTLEERNTQDEGTPVVIHKGSIGYISGFSHEPQIENDSHLTFNDGEVEFYLADNSVNRDDAVNRVGFKITAPTDLNYEQYKNAKIMRINYVNDKREYYPMTFNQVKDSLTHYESWPAIDEYLSKVEILINWENNDYTQTFTIDFDNVTLKQPTNEEQEKLGKIELISDFDGSSLVKNNHYYLSNGTIKYYETDSSIGRNEYGNRIGFKITAPNYLKDDIENLYNVNIDRITYYKDGSKVTKQMKFSDIVDHPEDNETFYYSWPLVTKDVAKIEIKAYWSENYFQSFTINLLSGIKFESLPTHIDYKDGLSKKHLETIHTLQASNKEITSSQGIEQLVNLDTLDISNNNLTTIDLSKNTKLKFLNIENNPFAKDITLYEGTNAIDKINTFINPVVLPSNLNYELLNQIENADKIQVSYGTENEETVTVAYEVDYNINYIEYITNNYQIIDDNIYSYNKDYEIEEIENVTSKIEDNKLNIYNIDNQLIKSFNLVRINIPKFTIEDFTKDYLYIKTPNSLLDDIEIITIPEIKENINITYQDNQLTLKYNDKVILDKKVIYITSEKYDITDSYIFTGIERINKVDTSVIERSEGIKLSTEQDNLIVKYNDEIIEELPIKCIASKENTYNLLEPFILIEKDTEFDIDNIEYPVDIVELIDNREENSLVTYKYKDIEYTYYILKTVENPYIIKDDNIYTKLNEQLDLEKISFVNTNISREDNKLIVKIGEVEKIYNIIEPTYTIPDNYIYNEDYIYIGTSEEESLLENIKNSNSSKDIKDNKLIIKSEIDTKSLDIISMTTDYKIIDNKIYTGLDNLDLEKVNVINGEPTINEENNTLSINNLVSYEIIKSKIESSKYDLNKDYIYLSNKELDKESFTLENTKYDITSTEIIFSNDIETLKTYKLLSISSTRYDITDSYIFTGIEGINTIDSSIIEHSEGIELSTVQDNLIVKYNDEELETLSIKCIASKENKYTYPFISLEDNEEFDIDNIEYDSSIIERIDNRNINNSIIYKYGEKEYTYYLVKVVENPYVIKENTIYSKFNERVDESKIKFTNALVNRRNNELIVKFGETEIKYNIVEPTYTISNNYIHGEDYIYIGTSEKEIAQTAITVTNANINLDDNQIVITSESDIEYIKIIKLTTSYDLSKNYIYTGNIKYDESKSSITNASITYEPINSTINITYKNELIASYPIITINSTVFDLSKKDLYTGLSDYIEDTITVTNGTIEKINDKLYIKSNSGTILDTYNILKSSYSSNDTKYNLDKEYIYLGTENLDLTKINVANAIAKEEENGSVLRIRKSDNNQILKSYKLIKISSNTYDLNKKYIYTGIKEYQTINVTGGATPVQSKNTLYIKYGNEVLDSYPIIKVKIDEYEYDEQNIYLGLDTLDKNYINIPEHATLEDKENVLLIKFNNEEVGRFNKIKSNVTSTKYDLSKKYIYLGTNTFDSNDIKVENAVMTKKGNDLIFTQGQKTIKVIKLISISSDKYIVSRPYIYTGIEAFDKNKITVPDCHTEFVNNRLNILYENDIVATYPVVTISGTYDLSSKKIYTGFNDLDETKIQVTNGKATKEGNKLSIIYDKDTITEFEIVKSSITSTKYPDLSKDYIYTGTNTFDIKDIIVTNATSKVENNILTISNDKGKLREYKIITISSDKYNLNKPYIYTGTTKLDTSKINVTKGGISILNNNLNIVYNQTVLASYPIISIESTEYDLSNSYLYTKLNTFNTNLVKVTNATKEIKNNQLIIKYGNETLKTVDLVNINLGKLNIKSNTILINSKIDYKDFIKEISCTLSTCKIVDKNNKIITSGSIENNMFIKVYYKDKEIDSFQTIVDYIELGDIKTDENKSYINNFKAGSSVTDIVKSISTSGKVKIISSTGKEIDKETKLATGQKVNIELNDVTISYTIVVKGDISGDGEIDVYDVGVLYQYLRNKMKLDNCFVVAGDVAGKNDGVDVYDVGILYQYLRGKIKNLEE